MVKKVGNRGSLTCFYSLGPQWMSMLMFCCRKSRVLSNKRTGPASYLSMSLSLQLLPHLPTTFSHTGLLSVSWICQAPSHQTFTAFRLFPGSYPPKFSTPHPANTYSSCRSQLKYHFLKLSFLGFPSLSSSLLFFCKTLASSLTHTHRDATGNWYKENRWLFVWCLSS